MMQYRVDFESISWEAPMDGLRFRAVRHDGRQLRMVEYTKDMEPHWCEKGHIGYLLDGEFEIRFDDGVSVFKPGDGIFIPSGREHRHMGKALTDVVQAVFVGDV